MLGLLLVISVTVLTATKFCQSSIKVAFRMNEFERLFLEIKQNSISCKLSYTTVFLGKKVHSKSFSKYFKIEINF